MLTFSAVTSLENHPEMTVELPVQEGALSKPKEAKLKSSRKKKKKKKKKKQGRWHRHFLHMYLVQFAQRCS
jgi:hypothetical protein